MSLRKPKDYSNSKIPSSSSLPSFTDQSNLGNSNSSSGSSANQTFRRRFKIGSFRSKASRKANEQVTIRISSRESDDPFKKTDSSPVASPTMAPTNETEGEAAVATIQPDLVLFPIKSSTSSSGSSASPIHPAMAKPLLPRTNSHPVSIKSLTAQPYTAQAAPISYQLSALGRPLSTTSDNALISPWSPQPSRFSGTESTYSQPENADELAGLHLKPDPFPKEDSRKQKSMSESFLPVHSESTSARNKSPLEQLIAGLGGRRSSVANTGRSTNSPSPLLASMSRLPAHLDLETMDPTHAAQIERIIQGQDAYQINKDSGEASLSEAVSEGLNLPSAWSRTNSAHSSTLPTVNGTRSTSPEPSLPLNSLQFQDSPMDPLLNRKRAESETEDVMPTPRVMQTSAMLDSDLKAGQGRPGRRWSIVEMEEAYARMKDLFASGRDSNLDSSLGLSQVDPDSSLGSLLEKHPYALFAQSATSTTRVEPHQTPQTVSTTLQPRKRIVSGDSTFTNEELDSLTPLRSDDPNNLADDSSDGANTPKTFVTSLSDPLGGRAASALDYNADSRYNSTSRVSDMINRQDLSEFGSLNGNVNGNRKHLTAPQAIVGRHKNNSLESVATTRAESYETPRTSVLVSKGDAGDHRLVHHWLEKSSNQHNNLLGSRSSSLSDQTAGRGSDRSLSTVGRERALKYNTVDQDPYFRPDSRNYNTWFEKTPAAKKRGGIPGHLLEHNRHRSESSFSNRSTRSTVTSQTFTEFREADKLELFLRFSQIETQYEALKKNSENERAALLDALHESRSEVHKLRSQRNDLDRRVSYLNKQYRDSDEQSEQLTKVMRSKALWQERAQQLAAELESSQRHIQDLQHQIKLSDKRESDLAQENLSLGSRLASLNAQLSSDHERRGSRSESEHSQSDLTEKEEATTVLSPPSGIKQISPKKATALPSPSSKSRLPSSPFATPSQSSRVRHVSTTSSANFDLGHSVSETPLIATQPTFSTQSPISVIEKVSGDDRETQSSIPTKSVKSKLPSPPNASRIGKGGGIPRMRNASSSTNSSDYHQRTPSMSSVGSFADDHVHNTPSRSTWQSSSTNSSSTGGLKPEHERFLSEVLE